MLLTFHPQPLLLPMSYPLHLLSSCSDSASTDSSTHGRAITTNLASTTGFSCNQRVASNTPSPPSGQTPTRQHPCPASDSNLVNLLTSCAQRAYRLLDKDWMVSLFGWFLYSSISTPAAPLVSAGTSRAPVPADVRDSGVAFRASSPPSQPLPRLSFPLAAACWARTSPT
jgi:hypothetical protein